METKIKPSAVDKLIYYMLSESTGTALCVSGGAYGRHWQENQKKTLKDWLNEPEVTITDDGWLINIFHYLRADLELDSFCKEFNKKFVPTKDWNSESYGVSLTGRAWLEEQEFKFERSFNSYNGDSALSQVIQGEWLELGDRHYLLLQIHQGCDVRGGYTDARLFYVPGYEDGALAEDVYGYITKKSGRITQVDNMQINCVTLNNENGNRVELEDGDELELNLAPR